MVLTFESIGQLKPDVLSTPRAGTSFTFPVCTRERMPEDGPQGDAVQAVAGRRLMDVSRR